MKCGGCGHFLDETTEALPNQWTVDRITCHACAAREMDAHKETPSGTRMPPGTKQVTRNRAAQ